MATEQTNQISQLQEEVAQLRATLQEVLARVKDIQIYQWDGNDHWLSVEDLCEYIPSHPAKQTVYGWLCRYDIPAYRIPGMNKNLMFLQSEIDEWLLKNRVKTSKSLDGKP